MLKKSYWLIILVLFSVISINAESQQSKPDNQSIEQKTNQTKYNEKISNPQNSNTSNPLPLQKITPPQDLKKTTDDKSAYGQTDSKKRWRDILNNPVDIFTGVIAFFTILLVAAGFRQVAITRNTAIRQLRTYVFVDTVDIFNVANPLPEDGQLDNPTGAEIRWPNQGPTVQLVIKNAGQTPAYEATHIGSICVREFPLNSVLTIDDTPARAITRGPIPPAGKTFKNLKMLTHLTDEEVIKLRNGTAAIYVYGNIVYNDTFGYNRITNFRFFQNIYSGIIGQATIMTICDEGNKAN